MHLSNEHFKQVQLVLKENLPEHEVWAFGSRVHGKRLKPFSDLDLVIIKPAVSTQKIMMLSDAFSESDLPFKIDVINWLDIDENFQNIIKAEYEVVQERQSFSPSKEA